MKLFGSMTVPNRLDAAKGNTNVTDSFLLQNRLQYR